MRTSHALAYFLVIARLALFVFLFGNSSELPSIPLGKKFFSAPLSLKRSDLCGWAHEAK
jgi:hypothetical protein